MNRQNIETEDVETKPIAWEHGSLPTFFLVVMKISVYLTGFGLLSASLHYQGNYSCVQ